MRSIGIDVGSRYVKAVIIDGKGKASYGCVPIHGDVKSSVRTAVKAASGKSGKKLFETTAVRMTGTGHAGKEMYRFSSPPQCLARAAAEFALDGGIIIDAGAMEVDGLMISHKGKIVDTGLNERCAAGGGRFLEVMAKALCIEFSQFDEFFKSSSNPYAITSGCIVFAESEVVTQVNAGRNLEDIVAGMITLVAGKAATVCDRMFESPEQPVYLTGGLAEFTSLRGEFERLAGVKCGEVPFAPIYATAYGAALLAGDGR